MMELYSDFLISSFGQTSATMLAQLLLGEVSHDQVTRFLRQEEAFSRTLWKLAKPFPVQAAIRGVLGRRDHLQFRRATLSRRESWPRP